MAIDLDVAIELIGVGPGDPVSLRFFDNGKDSHLLLTVSVDDPGGHGKGRGSAIGLRGRIYRGWNRAFDPGLGRHEGGRVNSHVLWRGFEGKRDLPVFGALALSCSFQAGEDQHSPVEVRQGQAAKTDIMDECPIRGAAAAASRCLNFIAIRKDQVGR